MLEDQENACGVVDTGVTAIGEENVLDFGAFGKGDYIFALAYLISFHIFNTIQ